MPSIGQSELKKKEFLVVRDNQTGEVVKVIFPNGIQVGVPGVENFNSGIILSNLAAAPSDTTNALYAINGNVYFNGVLIGAAGGANVTVKDEGSTLVTTLSSLNFTGAGVTATAAGNDVTVTVNSVPGGSDTYVQFNDGGTTFGGDSDFTYDKSANVLNVGNSELGSFDATAAYFSNKNATVATGYALYQADPIAGSKNTWINAPSGGRVYIANNDNSVAYFDDNEIILTGKAATTQTVTLGSTVSTSTTTIQAGSGGITLTGNTTASDDLAVNGGDLTSNQTTFNLLNSTVTSLNVGGDATSISIGDTTTSAQTLSIGGSSIGTSTYNVGTGATASARTKTLNLGTGGSAGSTTNVNLGSSRGGTVTVNNDLVVNGSMYSLQLSENLVLAMQVFG